MDPVAQGACKLASMVESSLTTEGWLTMPQLSLFYGIRITMYYDDHNPPHFHAEYAGHKALVDILRGCVMRGSLPNRQLRLVLAWTELHRDELMQDWALAQGGEEPLAIDGLA